MLYTLMHKNIPTAELDLDEVTGSIRRIEAVISPEHLPVGSLDWIAFDRLKGLDGEIDAILGQAGEYIDQVRRQAIVASVLKRIDRLEMMAQTCRRPVDEVSRDVESNVAADYE